MCASVKACKNFNIKSSDSEQASEQASKKNSKKEAEQKSKQASEQNPNKTQNQNENYDQDVSIIVSTQFGPHATTFKFLDNLIDYSDKHVSPLTFSHSVHNAAASYIASVLGIRGQSLTITSFQDPLKQALILADSWLSQKQAKRVLVCHIDEESHPLTLVHKHCDFPSYSKKKLRTQAACILLKEGDGFDIPEEIKDPFKFIQQL